MRPAARLREGLEESLPDPAARQMFEVWRRDPKQFERQLAAM